LDQWIGGGGWTQTSTDCQKEILSYKIGGLNRR